MFHDTVPLFSLFFSYTAPPPPHPSPLSLHDALPIFPEAVAPHREWAGPRVYVFVQAYNTNRVKSGELPKTFRDLLDPRWKRSEEHTSELQSRGHLVCRLLLEKKNNEKK